MELAREERMTNKALEGALLLDKPKGMTSHDVVDRLRRIARTRKIGHVGTLDPMATGLLVMLIGPTTRLAPYLSGLPKEYSGTITLGAFSSTYDAEGEITKQQSAPPTNAEAIRAAIRRQIGFRTQLPPPYSAVKVKGKRLYDYARSGEEIPQKPREVRIDQFEMLECNAREIQFRAKVGSGTYIRSMAHDLGVDLGCGAYLSALRRDSVGPFSVKQAISLDELEQIPERLFEVLLRPVEALAHMPKITVSAKAELDIQHGRAFGSRDILFAETLPQEDEPTCALDANGNLLAIVKGKPANSGDDPTLLHFRPIRVLIAPEML